MLYGLQIPLMRCPKSKDRLCVNCDAVYPDGQALEREVRE